MNSFESIRVTEEFKREAGPEFTKEKQKELARQILEEQYQRRKNLGKGKAAEVWDSDNDFLKKILCVKTTHDPTASVNNPSREFDLQLEYSKAGVRVPKAQILIQEKNDKLQKQDFIVMEKINGPNLEQLLDQMEAEDKKFTADEFKRISNDIAEQIEKAHAAGLYHRDLHFGNIMFDEEMNVYLIDFGDATTAFASSEDSEIYSTDTVRDGKPVRVVFPKDEDVLAEFRRNVIRRKFVQKAA